MRITHAWSLLLFSLALTACDKISSLGSNDETTEKAEDVDGVSPEPEAKPTTSAKAEGSAVAAQSAEPDGSADAPPTPVAYRPAPNVNPPTASASPSAAASAAPAAAASAKPAASASTDLTARIQNCLNKCQQLLGGCMSPGKTDGGLPMVPDIAKCQASSQACLESCR
ncbi:MAG: hypothetical protein VB934_06520 [Polyangiaceae bacterium]